MSVAGPGQILGGTAKFHQNRDFVDQFAGHGANDMGPQHPVGAGIGEDFDKAIGGLVGLGPTIGKEEEFACLVVDPLAFSSSSVLPTAAISGEV